MSQYILIVRSVPFFFMLVLVSLDWGCSGAALRQLGRTPTEAQGDSTAPLAILSLAPGQASLTRFPSDTTVSFVAQFSEPVVLGPSAFRVISQFSTARLSIHQDVTGMFALLTVTLAQSEPEGEVRVALVRDQVTDLSGNKLSLPTFEIHSPSVMRGIAPTVNIVRGPSQAAITASRFVDYYVMFSEKVDGFNLSQIKLVGAVQAASVVMTEIVRDRIEGEQYRIQIQINNGEGSVIPILESNRVTDSLGLGNLPSDPANSSVLYDAPPVVQIMGPVAGPYLKTSLDLTGSRTVWGTCSTDVRSITSTFLAVADGDCSDGTFSLVPHAFTLSDIGVHPITVTVSDSLGTVSSDTLTLTFQLVVILLPRPFGTFATNQDQLVISGEVARFVTGLSMNSPLGSILTFDPAAGTFSANSGTLVLADNVIDIYADAPGVSLLSGQPHPQYTYDRINLYRDVMPPPTAPPSAGWIFTPPSGDFNVPILSRSSLSESFIVVYSDSSCNIKLGEVGSTEVNSIGIPVPVKDNTTTTVYGRLYDAAGNPGPCGPLATYVETTNFNPVCDVNVAGDVSFASFQAILDGAQAQSAFHMTTDTRIVICLADGTRVYSDFAVDGDPLRIPGNNFVLMAPTGRASISYMRNDSAPKTAMFNSKVNLDIRNIDVSSTGVGIRQSGGNISLISDSRITSSQSNLSSDGLGGIAQIRNSTLRGSGNVYLNTGFVGWISDSIFENTSLNPSVYALQLVVGAYLSEMIDSRIDTSASGVFVSGGIYIRTPSSVSHFERNEILRRGTVAGSVAFNIESRTDHAWGKGFVNTPMVKNNAFCAPTFPLSQIWPVLLGLNGVEFTAPTQPYNFVYGAGPSGAGTFPHGSSSQMANDPWNLQAQWGGICPFPVNNSNGPGLN